MRSMLLNNSFEYKQKNPSWNPSGTHQQLSTLSYNGLEISCVHPLNASMNYAINGRIHNFPFQTINSRFISSTKHKNQKDFPEKIDVSSENRPPISTSNVSQRIQAAMQWRLSDLMGVLGAGLLFVGILVSPSVINKMKESNQNYEIDEINYDDVTALTQQVLEYVKEAQISRSTDKNGDSNVVIDASSDIISRVLQTEMVQEALINLSVKVVQSPEVLEAAKILVRNLFTDLVNDPETLAQVIDLLNKVVKDETVKKSVVDLVLQLTADEEIYQAVTKMVVSIGEEEEVIKATQALLTESAHKTLNDPEILDHSMEFAADVVGDDVVQRTSGEALWNTISYSFRPSFSHAISALGVSLICFSFYLLGPGRPPTFTADEAALVSNLASIGRDLHGNSKYGLSSLWALPHHLFSNASNAFKNVLFFPFRLMRNMFSGIFTSASQFIQYLSQSATHALLFIPNWIGKGISTAYRTGVTSVQRIIVTAGELVSSSFLGIWTMKTVELFKNVNSGCVNIFYDVNDKFLVIDKALEDLSRSCIHTWYRLSRNGEIIYRSWSWERILERLRNTGGIVALQWNERLRGVWVWFLLKLGKDGKNDIDGSKL